MNIKTIVIEGIDQDISIRRTERGAEATIEQHTRRAGRQDIPAPPAQMAIRGKRSCRPCAGSRGSPRPPPPARRTGLSSSSWMAART